MDQIRCAVNRAVQYPYAKTSAQTVAALGTFYLAMVKYPAVFKRAQDEIDKVVGSERLPTFSDRGDLPYIDAILKETLRWENVVSISTYNCIYLVASKSLI